MIRVLKIDHVALHVDDVAATAAFYTGILGPAPGSPPTMTPEMAALIGHLKSSTKTSGPTGGTWIETAGSQIHLIRAETTEDRVNPFGPHLAFEVESFDETKKTLLEQEIAFMEAPAGPHYTNFDCWTPSGNTVELWMKS